MYLGSVVRLCDGKQKNPDGGMRLQGPNGPEMRIWPRFFCALAEGLTCVTPVPATANVFGFIK